MTKCEVFLEYFDNLLLKAGINFNELPTDVKDFYEILGTSSGESEKPAFTEIGVQILEFMQQSTLKSCKAKEIAEGTVLPSRKVSGAMRKLVNDGYVEKYGENPVNYMITTKGKEIDLSNYKENLNNEKD